MTPSDNGRLSPAPKTGRGERKQIASGPVAGPSGGGSSPSSETSISFRPPSEMLVDEMIRELGSLFSLSATVIARAAHLFRELSARGVKVEVKSNVFRKLIPLVASGQLVAEAVATFAEEPRTLAVVSKLEPGEQLRLSTGGTIETLAAVNAVPTPMTVSEIVAKNYPAIVAGKVLTVAQQRVQLEARQKAATKSVTRATLTATESQIEALAKLLATEMEKHNLKTLSAAAAAELVSSAGWRPGMK